jgi:hypothetical protein
MKNYTLFFYNDLTPAGDEMKITFDAPNSMAAQGKVMIYDDGRLDEMGFQYFGLYETELGIENRIL